MILNKKHRNNSFILQAIIIFVFGVLGCSSVAQQVENTDAERDYWTNLYQSTIRYTVMLAENPFDLDVYFDQKGIQEVMILDRSNQQLLHDYWLQ